MKKNFLFWLLLTLSAIQLFICFILFGLNRNLRGMVSQTQHLLSVQKELSHSSQKAHILLDKMKQTFEALHKSRQATESLAQRSGNLKEINMRMEQEERSIDLMEKEIAALMPSTVKLADTLLTESGKLQSTMTAMKTQLQEAESAQHTLYRYTRKQARTLKKVPDFLFK